MSHPIIEGPVQLLKIVTPGAYWIKCAECKGSRLPSALKNKPYSDYYYPHQGDKVFVCDDDGFFYRATVCGRRKVPDGEFWRSVSDVPETGVWKYVVQLTDTFQVKDFDQQFVFPSYGLSSASCPSAHLVSLYHVLPRLPPTTYGKCIKIGTDEHKQFENAVVNWDQFLGFMSQITETQSKFTFVQSKLINGSVYGEISTYPSLPSTSGSHSLSDFVHLERLGALITFRFEEVVDALMTNSLIEHSDLLPTFDSSGKTSLLSKPFSPPEKLPDPVYDLAEFTVHPDDVVLHRSLCQGKFHWVNIFFTGPPLEDDVCVRYVCPNGVVILGTVLSIDLKISIVEDDYFSLTHNRFSKRASHCRSNDVVDEFSRMVYVENDQSSDDELNDESEKSFSYDFDEVRKHFEAAGGLFQEQYLPYPNLPIEKSILKYLETLGVDCLHDWQKLCLPTFCSRKNLLLLGSKSAGKLSTSLFSALSWMSLNHDDETNLKLIIFFSDLDRADKTATLCAKLTDFRVIISTSHIITTKQKNMASCDILVTTPCNWVKLVSEGVFDYSRLDHVIFDEFDRIQELHSDHIKDIFDALESSVRRVQTVVISNSYGEFISAIKVDITAYCVIDVILSFFHFGGTPTVIFVKRSDWTKQIENVIRKEKNKRLVICADESEGKSIVEQVSHFTEVCYVHKDSQKETALNFWWDNHHNKLLVTTNQFLEQFDFEMDVEVVISWMTSSRTTLSNRFRSFYRPQRLSLSVYLFCDCENLDDLLLMRSIASNVTFDGSLDQHLSRELFKAELVKASPVCPSVFMFGECRDVPICAYRHVFHLEDNPESSPLTHSLKVKILKVHSAFGYSVRVTEIVSNYVHMATENMNALISKLKEIEEGLFKSRANGCPTSLKIGDMVGARVGEALRRAIVQSEDSGTYTLSIVDFEEPDVRLHLSQLFTLLPEAANHPKDVVDLFITGLMPADFKSDWKHDTCNFVTGVLKQLGETYLLAGKVKMVTTNRSVLVESLSCLREDPQRKMALSIVSSGFCSLNNAILESGYCVENQAHLPSLSKLILKSATRSHDFVNPPSLRFSRHRIVMNREERFGFRTRLPKTPVRAQVSSFEHPGLFCVQLDEELEKLRIFEKRLSLTLNNSKCKLHLIAIHELCAVKYEGEWNRAIICDVICDINNSVDSVHIIFVDYGDTQVGVTPDQLYCLPEEFVRQPFFSIQCELVGIEPLNRKTWNKETIEKFQTLVRDGDDAMKDLLVKFVGPKSWEQSSEFFDSQTAVLWDPQNPHVSFNRSLARGGLARFDPATQHLVDGE